VEGFAAHRDPVAYADFHRIGETPADKDHIFIVRVEKPPLGEKFRLKNGVDLCFDFRLYAVDADRKSSRPIGDQTAGIGVLWRENNSGCKGVCDRVDTDELAEADVVEFCATGECFDEVLLANLQDYVSTLKKDTVIVLHQKGSHGPAYYLRYPEAFAVFKPVCATNQLQNCQQSEITNGYDNTILYTDYFLGQVIGFLKQNSVQFSTAMLYLSDHGESLGENNIYLHGLPYMMAPAEQTHIPMALWLPDVAYGQRWSRSCLDKASQGSLSHDNLFHSVLGFMGVQTKVYSSELDFFSNCQLKK